MQTRFELIPVLPAAIRAKIVAVILVPSVVACQGSNAPGRPSASVVPLATSSAAAAADVPAGTIAFNRVDESGVEHYFTIRTDGTSEVALFSAEGCSCIGWSPTGEELWSVSLPEAGSVAFTTIQPDGSNRTVVEAPIPTLNLAPGAGTPDGRLIAFTGWDETEPLNSGLWLGSPDLSDLRQVIPLPEGVIGIDTMAITADGTRIVFFAEQGSEAYVTHAGALFAVNADGTGLQQLSPEGVHLAVVRGRPFSLSPDGNRVAFAAFEGHPDEELGAVYVVSIDGGEAERITEPAGGIWSAAWSPMGEQIAYAQSWDQSMVSVVNADGSGQRDLTDSATDEVSFGVWSPDGRYLLTARGPEEARDLWIIDTSGTFVAPVTHEPARYDMYAWSP